MTAEAIIKSQARSILKENFVKAILAMLIVLLPFFIIDGATTAISCVIINYVSDEKLISVFAYAIGYPLSLVAGFLLSPVMNGYIRAFYKAAYTNTIDLRDVFYYFGAQHYFSALQLNIRYILRMFIPVLLLYSPLIAYDLISAGIGSDFVGTTLYQDVYFILAVLSTLAASLYSLKYFTVFTVSADNPQFTPKEVFAYNKYIMKHHTGDVAKLIFSFTPWMLLGLLVLPLLYVIPYITQSLCVSAKWLTKSALESNP